jgi:hypothetical protein
MIAEAAYFRAERRGFDGDQVADWIAAEREVDAELRRIEREHVVARLEVGLATATKKLTTLKLSSLTTGAKSEWQQDAVKLAGLRDTLRQRLKEVRGESEEAGEKARRQAENIWDEITQIIHRVSSATRH